MILKVSPHQSPGVPVAVVAVQEGRGEAGAGRGHWRGSHPHPRTHRPTSQPADKSLLYQHYGSITNPLYLGPVNGDKVLGDGDVGLPLLVLGDILLFLLPLPLILIPLLWENIDYIYIVEHWSLSLICQKTQSD